MAETKTIIAEYETAITVKERDLLALKAEVWKFLDTTHTLKETKIVQANVRAADTQVGEILNLILSDNRLSEFRNEAEQLCKRTRDLTTNYSEKMAKALADDYADLKRDYDSRRFDVLKEVGTLLAVPGAFLTFVKYGVGDGKISSDEAVKFGFIISVPIFFRRQIVASFKAAAKSAVEVPKEIRNSFMLYYVKENLKDAVRGTVKAIGFSRNADTPKF